MNDQKNEIISSDEFTNFVLFAILASLGLYWKVPSEEKENYHRLKQTPGSCSIEEMKKKQLSYELEFILFSLGCDYQISGDSYKELMERKLTLNNLTNMVAIMKAKEVSSIVYIARQIATV